jgi:hypothetical protein
MLTLKFNDQTIKTFDEKAKKFKSVFFSTSSSIELNDISKSFLFSLDKMLFQHNKAKNAEDHQTNRVR